MLTIEELKNLPLGEWVWIVESENAYTTHDFHGEYCRKVPPYLDGFCYGWQGSGGFYKYEEYSTKWLAYKNKEEAEGKSITLPYLLCTSSKFACVVWRDTEGKVHKTYTMPIDEAKGVLKEKERLCHSNE